MTTFSSPPSAPSVAENLEGRLEAQIQQIRHEISRLRTEKQKLSSALLGNPKIQKYATTRTTSRNGQNDNLQVRLEAAIEKKQNETQVKVHRMALGVTAFPFTDPSPERRGEPAMLGMRFDLNVPRFLPDPAEEPAQNHEQEKDNDTYFIILRRIHHAGLTYLKIHTNTIPKHIDVEGYADAYLPLPDALQETDDPLNPMDTDTAGGEDSFQDDSGIDVTQDISLDDTESTPTLTPAAAAISSTSAPVTGTNQSLHIFVQKVQADLTSWHYRTHSIRHLQLSLQVPVCSSPSFPTTTSRTGLYNISSLVPTTADSTSIRIVWSNTTLALLRLGRDGYLSRVVVYGPRASPSTQDSGQSTHSGSSDFESDDARNGIRSSSAKDANHVRLFDVERILGRRENGDRVRIGEVVARLSVIHERGLCR